MKNTLYHGRPEDVSDRLEKEIACYALLDSLGVAYDRVDHDFADTIEACEAVEQVLGEKICKNLFLCNRQKTSFYLLMMPGEKVFKTKDLSKQLGVTRLSFASPPVLEDARFGCHPCINSSTLAIATQDLMQKILPAVHHEAILVDLPEEAAEG